jgi:hypothetical protein
MITNTRRKLNFVNNTKAALILLFMLVFADFKSVGQNIALLPMPQSIQFRGGFLEIGDWDIVTVSYPVLENERTNARQQIETILEGKEVRWVNTTSAQLIFALEGNSDVFSSKSPEAYSIKIDRGRVSVSARTESGLFYAVQTLKQLFDTSIHKKIPLCTIEDFPTFSNRGVMDDISRGPLPNLEFAKEQIRRLSSLKYNIFTFYVEHVVKTRKHGSFAPADGLTLSEIEELSSYARLHNVQLVGSFQSLGHFEKILEFPQYSNLGSTTRMLEPGDSASVAFVSEILDEMAPPFNADYFNLNGDEAWDLDRAAKENPSGLSAGQLYLKHMKPLLQNLIDKDIRPMMWGDILMHHPYIIPDLPKETIVLTWDYSDRDSFSEWIEPFRDIELDYWVCPGVLNSNRFFPNFYEAFGNISGFLEEGLENNAAGMLLTVWDDGGRHFFSRDWIGVAFGAEQSWNTSSEFRDTFPRRFSSTMYGDTSGIFFEMLEKLTLLKKSPAMPNLNNGAFVKDIFPGKDQVVSFSAKDWEFILATASASLKIAENLQNTVKKNDSDIDFWLFTIKQIELLADSRLTMIELTQKYEESCRNQLVQPDAVRESLQMISEELTLLEADWNSIFSQFKNLWLAENRFYWTEEANTPYEKHLSDLSRLSARIKTIADTFNPSEEIYLPAPSKVGLTVNNIRSSYFTYWLITGPFKINEYEKDVTIDFLADAGGEKNVRPIPGQLFKNEKGQTMMWDKVASNYDDRVVLGEIFQDNTKAVAYSYCQIKTAKAIDVEANFGSHDGLTIILNGDEVFRQNVKRNMIKGENTVKLSLVEGTNHLLLKTDQWKGRWEFSFGLEGVEWTSHKHKYTLE